MSPPNDAADYTRSLSAASEALHAAPRRAEVPLECAGMRLDRILAHLFPEYSRSRLQTWVRQARVTVEEHLHQPVAQEPLGAASAAPRRALRGDVVDEPRALAPERLELLRGEQVPPVERVGALAEEVRDGDAVVREV